MDKGSWRYLMIWKLKQEALRQSVESEAAMAHKVVHPNVTSTSIHFCTDVIYVHHEIYNLDLTWKRTSW